MRYVDMLSDFPDGEEINIPSIGVSAYDYEEGQPIKLYAIDTGNFVFRITDYKASGTYITRSSVRMPSTLLARLPLSQSRPVPC